jgi:hypothetical protein
LRSRGGLVRVDYEHRVDHSAAAKGATFYSPALTAAATWYTFVNHTIFLQSMMIAVACVLISLALAIAIPGKH